MMASNSGKLWTCGGCGTVAVWGPSWQWYGSMKDLDDGKPIAVACTDDCIKKAAKTYAKQREKGVPLSAIMKPKEITPTRAAKMLMDGVIDKAKFDELYEEWIDIGL